VETGNPHLVARLHDGEGKQFLWIVNPDRSAQSGRLKVDGADVQGRAL